MDTSGLLAFFDATEPDHRAVTGILEAAAQPFVVSPYVMAEVDYLVASRLGTRAELAVLQELAGGAWDLPAFGQEDVASAQAVIARYADQSIGLADASNVILAARYRTRTILTLDRRHFGVLRTLDGEPFTIVP